MQAGGSDDFDFDSTWKAVQPDDVVTLIYTSGTTGNPKGVELTHANLLFETFAVESVLAASSVIASRLYFRPRTSPIGGVSVHADGVRNPDHGRTRPARHRSRTSGLPSDDVGSGSPGVEKLNAAVELAVANEPDDPSRRVPVGTGGGRRESRRTGGRDACSRGIRSGVGEGRQLVLSTLRAKLGFAELKWAVSSAAPIPKETLAFFTGIGIPIAEVWGMSELSCVATVSHPSDARLGTVGKLVPGMEGRIADDGEFLVRGPLVMKGYRKEPEKTAEAVDEDGWLHTGDILEADEDGYLKVVDRKKELIINAAGKNMSPANIENTIKAACPLIGVMLVVGDARPYNTALIVLDAESAGPYAAQRGLADSSPEALAVDPDVIAEIAAGVAEGNAKLSKVEQIKRFRVLPTFWEPGGDEITLTMKLKRKPIHEKYGAEIDELYAPEIADAVHEPKAAASAAPSFPRPPGTSAYGSTSLPRSSTPSPPTPNSCRDGRPGSPRVGCGRPRTAGWPIRRWVKSPSSSRLPTITASSTTWCGCRQARRCTTRCG